MSSTTQNNSRDYGGLPRADDPYSGHLWRLATLRRFLTQEAGLDWDRVWAGLVDTVRWGTGTGHTALDTSALVTIVS